MSRTSAAPRRLWMGMFSTGTWRVLSSADFAAIAGEAGDSIGVEITEAEDFSDTAVQAILGFIKRLAEETAGSEVAVAVERSAAGTLRFRFRWLAPA